MRHHITVQQGTASVDSYGKRTYTWSTLQDVWADIKAVRWAEGMTADQRKASATHSFVIRNPNVVVAYGSDDSDVITPKHRIVFGNRTFEILGVVDPDGRGRYQVIDAREVV